MIMGITAGQMAVVASEATAYKYWRFTVTENEVPDIDGFKNGLFEVKLFNGASAVTMTGTATASNYYPGLIPANAFDGNAATQWATESGVLLPQWIMCNLSVAAIATSVKIQSGDTSARAARAPKAFTVEASNDGSSFTTIASFSSIPSWGLTETKEFIF